MSKTIVLMLFTLLTLSSLVMVEAVSAQSIPKPSVPEFTVTGESLSGWGDRVVRISVTIKNQPFTPYMEVDGSSVDLFYNVSWKGHDVDAWMYYHHNIYQVDYLKASSSDETFVSFDLGGPELGGIYGGGQADIRVQALIGGYTYSRQPFYPMDVYDVEFTGETSGWSEAQILAIPESPTPSPEPTLTPPNMGPTSPPSQENLLTQEQMVILGVAVTVAVIVAGLGLLVYLIKRKR